MRIFSKYNIIGLFLLLMSLVSCETLETAEQDVSSLVSTDGYPVATFVSSAPDNSIFEGDTLVYTITMNKMLDRAVTFDARFVSGTATEENYTVVPAVMAAYSTETQLLIIFNDDGATNASRTAAFEIGVFGIAEHYLMNPSQVYPTFTMTVKEYFMTISMSWATDIDYDIVIWSDTETNPLTEWGDMGATSSNPEVDKSLWLTDPVGTYYVNIMDWDSGPFDYTFTINNVDGTTQTITGTFDKATKTYVNDPWTAWGDSYDSYRVLKVVNDGVTFTVTQL